MTKIFHLTEAHIRNRRLTAQDYSAYAGHPVFVFNLSELPHWEAARTKRLDQDMERERIEAVRQIARQLDPKSKYINYGDMQSIAWAHGAAAGPLTMKRVAVNPRDIPNYLTLAGDLTTSQLDKPCPYKPMDREPGTILGLWRKVASLTQAPLTAVMAPTMGEDRGNLALVFPLRAASTMLIAHEPGEKEAWANFIGVSADRISFFPNEGFHELTAQLHEMRHLRQMHEPRPSIQRKVQYNGSDGYYVELDAELYALLSLKEADVGHETIKANINARYLQTFFTKTDYWFAPALENLLSGKQPPNPLQIYDAVSEIHCRLAMQDKDMDQREFSSRQIQNAIALCENRAKDENCGGLTASIMDGLLLHYDQNIKDAFRENSAKFDPGMMEKILPNLRKLHEDGVLADPLSSQIAGRILEAGEYFSAGISYRPKPGPLQHHRWPAAVF
ncbi:MAG: hypothetical protein WDO70_02275 [Alphaproteobacteria bacterium]